MWLYCAKMAVVDVVDFYSGRTVKVQVLSPDMTVNDLKIVVKTKIENIQEKRLVFRGEIVPDNQFVLSIV